MILSAAVTLALMNQCQNVVDTSVLMSIANLESSRDEFAVGIVGLTSTFKPKDKAEAIQYIKELDKSGANYSVGLMQVNKHNFSQYGLTLDTAFDHCKNIEAGAKIFNECFQRAKVRSPNKSNDDLLNDSASCYYSGNFTRGYKKEENRKFTYVEKFQRFQGKDIGDEKEAIQPPYREPEIVTKEPAPWDVFGELSG